MPRFEKAAAPSDVDTSLGTDSAHRTLDELFRLTSRYKLSKDYGELLNFMRRFRTYSPYNAVLVNIQMPGARFVASPRRWQRKYHHQIKPGEHPLLMLQPMGPVMFAFDVSDAGSQHAGQIGTASTSAYLEFVVGAGPSREVVSVPVRYELLLSDGLSAEASYATLVHELAHLYCGHLGTPNVSWWPDRRTLSKADREFEESLFVKNLENVQGDERDVIFISTVYGKDRKGSFFQRFGPINGTYGHRRLNALFTRAKKKVTVFTSMVPEEIQDEDKHWGVKVLKHYLQFARDGIAVLPTTNGQCESEFEQWVLQVLQSHGYEGVPQVGICGYRIDMGR